MRDIYREIASKAHQRFEALVKECVERNLGCEVWQGLADRRVECLYGTFIVDGKPVCKTTPVVFEDGAFKFGFEDLTKEPKS
jgi:hypothetical protein